MNAKRWLLASIVVLVVVFVLEFVVHGVLLSNIYKQTASVWRPEAEIQKMMWLFWVGYLIFAPVFTLIYVKGYESGKSGIGQGLRYGTYMGLLTGVAMTFGWYVVLPIPVLLAVYWAIAGFVETVAAGIAAGLTYKP